MMSKEANRKSQTPCNNITWFVGGDGFGNLNLAKACQLKSGKSLQYLRENEYDRDAPSLTKAAIHITSYLRRCDVMT